MGNQRNFGLMQFRLSVTSAYRVSLVSPEKIPSVKAFSPERSTAIVFEDLCLASEHIQNRIGQFFGNGRHRNISCVYVTQKYHKM